MIVSIYTVKLTYWRRQKQPIQTTVMQMIEAAAAIITMTTNTENKYSKTSASARRISRHTPSYDQQVRQ